MYGSINSLPAKLRDNLPDDACELYRATYNRVWEKCAAGGVQESEDVSKKAHDAALMSVQQEFARDAQGKWHRQPVGAEMDHLGAAAEDSS